MQWLPILGVLTGLLLLVIQEDSVAANQEDEIRLGVTIRNRDMLDRAPSCIHTFSRVELVNQNNAELVIKSIEISPERTVRVDSSGFEIDGIVYDSLSQQVVASRVTNNFVTLDPGQGAIVPLTFLPRFPSPKSEGETLVAMPSNINPWLQADREGWIGSVSIRNNLGLEVEKPEVYSVTTELLVKTNYGIARVPFDANSVRENPYSLPDSIYFTTGKDHGPNSDSPHQFPYTAGNGYRVVDGFWGTFSPDDTREVEPECYDLYLKHPKEESIFSVDLQVQEIMVSRPQNMSVQIVAGKSPDAFLISTGPRHVIREWTEEGPLLIPPDDQQHYIATICTASGGLERDAETDEYVGEKASWIDAPDAQGSLGFVQIRTSSETLFISLLESSGASKNETRAWRYTSRESDTDISADAGINSTIKAADPGRLDILLMEGTSGDIFYVVDLNNTGNTNVSMMRGSIVFSESDSTSLDDLGIKFSILPLNIMDNEGVVEPGETLEDAANVSISWGKFNLDSNTSYELRGVIIFQGSSRYKSPTAWSRAATLDPSLDMDLILEMPIIVRCAKGKMGIGRLVSAVTNTLLSLADNVVGDTDNPIGAIQASFFPGCVSALKALYEKRPVPIPFHNSIRILEHTFRAITSVNATFEVRSVWIDDDDGDVYSAQDGSLCESFRVSATPMDELREMPPRERQRLTVPPLKDGVSDFGIIFLSYNLPETDNPDDISGRDGSIFAKCHLRFRTKPESGIHSVPLLIYSGRVDISVGGVERSEKYAASGLVSGSEQNRVRSIVGFPDFLDWFQASKAGASLRSLLGSKKTDDDEVLLSRYMFGLAKSPVDAETMSLLPVILNIGAINPDEEETFPLFVYNYNPEPAFLKVDVGEVEGLRVLLGRDPVSRDELLSHSATNDSGVAHGHPIEGLRQFLHIDPKARSLLSFGFRDAIHMAPNNSPQNSLLEALFDEQSCVHYHKFAAPLGYGSQGKCTNPDQLQPHAKFMRGRKHPGPVIISTSSKSVRALSYCDNSTSNGDREKKTPLIVLPAGGVARFEVTLRSPPLNLLDHDVSQFLSTGLVLTTENGIVVPIFVTFETPRGKLEVSPDGFETISKHGNRAMIIPAGTFAPKSTPSEAVVRIPPKSRSFDGITVRDMVRLKTDSSDPGVPLFMSSSFNRPVELLEVSSCSPLFEVELRNGSGFVSNDPLLGVNIGKVKNVVPCRVPVDDGKPILSHQSFFLCALDWLAGRRIQPPGCGSRLSSDSDASMNGTDSTEATRIEYRLANRDFVRALFISAWSLGESHDNSQRRSFDGTVAPALVDTVAKAWDTWRSGEESKLLRLSTNLRAVIRYNSSDTESGEKDQEPQLLSLGVGNLTIESYLRFPSLSRQDNSNGRSIRDQDIITVDFPNTYVGAVSSRMIQVSNPTSTPVRVRLARAPPSEEFENYVGKDALKILISLRHEFLTEHEVPYTQSGLKAQSSGEYVSHQWWDGGGSFFMADAWGGLIRSHYNITVRAASGAIVSLLSPGLISNVAFIAGCGTRCGIKDEVVKFDGPHDIRLSSFIGASAAASAVLMGQQRSSTEQNNPGPLFRAAGSMLTSGKGPAPFAVPFFALQEEVVIPAYGKAELGPVLFRPPGRTKYMGCESKHAKEVPPHCADTNFSSILFLENSLTGLERVMLRGKAVWEKLTFQDIPTQDNDNYDAFSDIEVRNGRDSLIFSGTAKFRPYGSPAVVKQLALRNDGDIPVTISSPYLASATNLIRKIESPNPKVCSLGEFTLYPCSVNGGVIRLDPGENHTFFVKHEPKCTQLSAFVAVIVDYEREGGYGDDGSHSRFYKGHSRKGSFRKSREELLVGYKMTAAELAACVPSGGHVVFRFLDAMDKLGLKRPENNIFEGYGMLAILAFALTYTCIILTVTASGLILIRKLIWRWAVSSSFKKRLVGGAERNDSALLDSNWLATLRCLSRFDPSSQDLQTLGREQTRLLLLNQFHTHGVLPPLCLNTHGVFQRERNATTRQAGSKSGISSGGSERIRTLSDAIFKNGRPCFTPSGGLGSFGAGWKTALARGIINDFTLQRFKVELSTEELLQRRRENPNVVFEDESEEFDSSSSEGNEIDSTDNTSYVGNEENQQTGQSEDGARKEEIDSDSEGTEDLSEDGCGGRNVDPETKATSDTNSPTSSLHDMSASSSNNGETAEYTKVIHKGKSMKKTQRTRSGGREGVKNIAASGTPSSSTNHAAKPSQPSSTKIVVHQQGSRRRIGKSRNGKLSAKATPYEPKPAEAYGVKPPSDSSVPNVSVESKDVAPFPQPRFRPPPGLAPPPGFENTQYMSPTRAPVASAHPQAPLASRFTPSRIPDSPSNPTTVPIPIERSHSPIMGDDIPLSAPITSPTRPPFVEHLPTVQNNPMEALLVGPQSPPRTQSSQNMSDGFDIMDFLDGILNEGSTLPPPDTAAQHLASDGSSVSSPSLLPIPLNPWAAAAAAESNEYRSRAMAYGINFDEDHSDRINEGGLEVDLPMLMPATILGQTDDNEEKNNQGSSIYTNFMK